MVQLNESSVGVGQGFANLCKNTKDSTLESIAHEICMPAFFPPPFGLVRLLFSPVQLDYMPYDVRDVICNSRIK